MFLTDVQPRDVAIIITGVVILVAVVSITYEPTYVWWKRLLLNYASNLYILLALILVFFQNSIWKRNLKILFIVSLFIILVLVDVIETVYIQHKYPDLLTALKNIDDYKWLIVLQFFIFVGIGYVFMTRKLLYFKNDPDNNYRQFITIQQTLLKSLGEKEKKYFEKIREEKMNLNGNDNDFYTYYSYDMFNALPRNIQKKFLENYYRRIYEHKEILKTRPWDRKQITPLTKLEFHKIGIGDAITELMPDN